MAAALAALATSHTGLTPNSHGDVDYRAVHRATLALQCDGLSDEDLRRQSTPPSALSLDVTGYQPKWDEDVSLRLVVLQLIHEYARHNVHADFLREGSTGSSGREINQRHAAGVKHQVRGDRVKHPLRQDIRVGRAVPLTEDSTHDRVHVCQVCADRVSSSVA